jgi:membrane protein YqaA with SNARE-associated domain
VAAYFTAFIFLEFIMQFMTPAMLATFDEVLKMREMGTFFLTLAGAFTPIPYTTTAYVIAAMHGNIIAFILASIIGRGLRYSAVGILVYYFGPTAIKYAKRSIAITSVVFLTIAAFYVWYKFF